MKKIIKTLVILVIIVGLSVGGLFAFYNYKQSKSKAKVVSVETIGTTEMWADNISSYGQVTSEKSQMGYLPKKSEVLSVNVKEGDHVEAGQVIISVKKDRQDINNKRLEIEKANQELRVEQIKLDRLIKQEPVPEYIYSQDVYDSISYLQTIKYIVASEDTFSFKGTDYSKDELVAEEQLDTNGESLEMVAFKKAKNADGTDKVDSEGKQVYDKITLDEKDAKVIKDTSESVLSRQKIEGTTEYLRSTSYYDAETHKMVGEISYNKNGTVASEKKKPTGMTAKELNEAIAEQQNVLKMKDLELRKLNYEYETIANSSDEGEVYAKVSGKVSKLQSIDNYNTSQPFFIITATDDYFVTGAIGEYNLKDLKIGDTVDISSWEDGSSASAVVEAISDTPIKEENGYYSSDGNINASNYEFRASIDKNSGIGIGTNVNININSAAKGQAGIYIPKYMVKKDATGSYVMKMGKKGLLKKQYVEVGKSFWGEMLQIKEGVSEKDYLAFPYGKACKEGMKCEKVDTLDDGYGGLG